MSRAQAMLDQGNATVHQASSSTGKTISFNGKSFVCADQATTVNGMTGHWAIRKALQ
jgi:hypothetical protein